MLSHALSHRRNDLIPPGIHRLKEPVRATHRLFLSSQNLGYTYLTVILSRCARNRKVPRLTGLYGVR